VGSAAGRRTAAVAASGGVAGWQRRLTEFRQDVGVQA